MKKQINCMSIDLEDWYHIYPIEKWDSCIPKVEKITYWILNEFAKRKITATFFVLGYIAERHPELIKAIQKEGHEIGNHGYDHSSVHLKTPETFEKDIKRSQEAIENIIGHSTNIYRAPSFSIDPQRKKIWQILLKNEINRDSSLFLPQKINNCPLPHKPFLIPIENSKIYEFPVTSHNFFSFYIPFSGSGYFRMLPYFLSEKWMRNSLDPVIFYFHPRDLDPETPDIPELKGLQRFKIYHGLQKSKSKFIKLIERNQFSCIGSLFKDTGYNTCNIWDTTDKEKVRK